jgi:hypothetical protein
MPPGEKYLAGGAWGFSLGRHGCYWILYNNPKYVRGSSNENVAVAQRAPLRIHNACRRAREAQLGKRDLTRRSRPKVQNLNVPACKHGQRVGIAYPAYTAPTIATPLLLIIIFVSKSLALELERATYFERRFESPRRSFRPSDIPHAPLSCLVKDPKLAAIPRAEPDIRVRRASRKTYRQRHNFAGFHMAGGRGACVLAQRR